MTTKQGFYAELQNEKKKNYASFSPLVIKMHQTCFFKFDEDPQPQKTTI